MNDRTRSAPISTDPEGESAPASRRLHRRHRSWPHEHSLSVATGSIVMALLALYWRRSRYTPRLVLRQRRRGLAGLVRHGRAGADVDRLDLVVRAD
jgi:hypothetical protein